MLTALIDPNETDVRVQGAVLSQLLAAYPAWHTEDELVGAVLGLDADFADRDDARRAVRDMVAEGVLHRHGDFLLPTRATVRCSALLDDDAGAGGR
jgi:hypothetical protein